MIWEKDTLKWLCLTDKICDIKGKNYIIYGYKTKINLLYQILKTMSWKYVLIYIKNSKKIVNLIERPLIINV